ncbi:hypothetical protein EQV77_16620 [Halobacillus fulvus]|nr:hypothetical protein EQV77_16620 [Halobacillus fulvus]
MKRKSNRGVIVLFVLGLAVCLVGGITLWLWNTPGQQAKETLETFYDFEQEGSFSSSWEMFHPFMKQKFTKGHYIQDRAHVFMNHFGVTTFEYEILELQELKKWKPDKESDPIPIVYSATILQTYKGKYGNFTIHQEVFVAKEEDEWTILWDYNK